MKPIVLAPPLEVVGGAEVGGADVGGRDVVGGAEDGWPVVLPVQATPLSAKLVGAGLLLLFHEALNPGFAVALVARLPFQSALRAVTWAPLWVTVAFHAWVTCWPAVNDQVNVQLVSGSPRFVRMMLAPNPPGHWFVTV